MISNAELNELTVLKDRLVVMAICRKTGRTDWEFTTEMWDRGSWTVYNDGAELFKFDGRDMFILGPVEWDIESAKHRRPYKWLFDTKDFEHHTEEDERG